MTDGMTFDFSEIPTLGAKLEHAPEDAGPRLIAALEHSAFETKTRWADKLTGENGLPHAARSIVYDLDHVAREEQSSLTATIGSETGRLQAPMVTVLEFGAPGNNTAPRGYGAGALQETQEDFQRGLGIAIGDPLK